MAEQSPYERQLREACRLITEQMDMGGDRRTGKGQAASHDNIETAWELVFQSRSGPPSQPWLEPDIRDYLKRLHAEGVTDVAIAPIGFLAENMEVVYDLDVEVRNLCDELGINLVRAEVVGSHPRFVRMIRELVVERLDPTSPRLALGPDGPWPDTCPSGCCRHE
jgi:ferrochelatase